MKVSTPQIELLLRSVYERMCGSHDDQKTREFIFHMRDWEADLLRLAEMYRDPSRHSEQECKAAVDGLLLHACAHIVQAARLYGGIVDPFAENSVGRS